MEAFFYCFGIASFLLSTGVVLFLVGLLIWYVKDKREENKHNHRQDEIKSNNKKQLDFWKGQFISQCLKRYTLQEIDKFIAEAEQALRMENNEIARQAQSDYLDALNTVYVLKSVGIVDCRSDP